MGGSNEVSTHTYYYYKVYFPSTGIIASEPIYIYSANGALLYTVGPNESRMDYENGIWDVPGTEQNTTIESVSTASFWVNYESSNLTIDYENSVFYISKALISNPNYYTVTADFEYTTCLVTIDNARNMFDGRWDTQAQVVFSAKPPAGYAFAVMDLGQEYEIQAIDITAGFFRPDDDRKFDMTNKYSLKYSTDGTNYYPICNKLTNFDLSGGAALSVEIDDLGVDFNVRYFKLEIRDMGDIEYGETTTTTDNTGQEITFTSSVWCAAFVEFAAYHNVVLTGEAFLSPTTTLSSAVVSGAGTVNVLSTEGFPSAGSAYLAETAGSEDAFSYGGKTDTSFTSVSGIDWNHADNSRVSQYIESETRLYDDDGIYPKIGDKIYKESEINEYLYTQELADARAMDYLEEFYKNHTKCTASVPFGPQYRVGCTVYVAEEGHNYFIESISGTEKSLEITLAYYP